MIWVLGVGLLIGIFVGGFLVFYLSNWQEVARVNDESFGLIVRNNLREVLSETLPMTEEERKEFSVNVENACRSAIEAMTSPELSDEEIREFDFETVRQATAEILERLKNVESQVVVKQNP